MHTRTGPPSRAATAPPRTAPIKVLHVLWNGETGGAERAVYQLVREQMRDPGLDPSVGFARPAGPYVDRLRALGTPVVHLDLRRGADLPAVPRLGRAMRPYDLHHFHSAEPAMMLASSLCGDSRRVYTHRGGITDYDRRKRLQYGLTGVLLRRRFNALSGNTAHAARCAAELFRIGGERIEVTYNGLEFELLEARRTRAEARASLGLRDTHFVVGTSAHLKSWKRIERLIDAAAALALPHLRILVVGDGADRSRLEARASALGVSDRVLFVGMQQHISDFLIAMDAFSLPSMGLESFGNSAVEAMAVGLPTIVFADGGGLVEHIEDGRTGFVVNDQQELESALARLAGDRQLRASLGKAASADIRARYTLAASGLAYRCLYAAALA
ncbi:MAG: glycosyltransferase [Thermoleophilaceae bacterium]|nr:glycosyltransferase [Thermoleophilaceae bacterium]